MTDLISVIVATYNRPDALSAVLRGLSRQTDRNFEILIADDGSGPATAEAVKRWAAGMDIPLIHVWHEDRGFRLAEIRNRAILRSRGDYCIFLDGDCIPRSHFVAAHRRLAEPGWFVAGNRALLSRAITERALAHGLEPETWGPADIMRQRVAGGVNRIAALLSLPARTTAQSECRALARRARRQSRDLPQRSQQGRRVRRLVQRLGPRGFRHHGAAHPQRRLPQGWPVSGRLEGRPCAHACRLSARRHRVELLRLSAPTRPRGGSGYRSISRRPGHHPERPTHGLLAAINRLGRTGARPRAWDRRVTSAFRRTATGSSGADAIVTANPHNQVFAVAIQLGLVGAALLIAMWIAHLLVVVVQNIVSSLFNSHLTDFTQGWTYVFGVGVLGGLVMRGSRAPAGLAVRFPQ